MADFSSFRELLSTEQKVFLAINILLLGKDAQFVFKLEQNDIALYQQVFQDLMKISAEVRLPYLGTFLRENSELAKKKLSQIVEAEGIELDFYSS